MGETNKAIDNLIRRLQTFPQDMTARLKLADLYAMNGETEDAVRHYQIAAEQCEQEKSLRKAAAIHKRVLKYDEFNLHSSARLIRLYHELGLEERPSALATSFGRYLDNIPDEEQVRLLKIVSRELGSAFLEKRIYESVIGAR